MNTPDGDFIDLDFSQVDGITELDETSPIVLLLHGLGGSAKGTYAYESYRQLAQVGIRCVGMNYRSCSGEINNVPRTYHAGATDDVALVVDWLRQRYPNVPLGMIGFSLGANMLLKYLGEVERNIVSAVAVSPPFDLAAGSRVLAQRSRLPYSWTILSKLKQGIREKEHQLKHIVKVESVMAAKTLYEFDQVCTVPLHGFKSVQDYFEQCSSQRFIPSIATPTLIIRALDDPFFDPQDIPVGVIEKNGWVQLEAPHHGGHVGFAEGFPGRLTWWANQQAALYLAAHLCA